MVNEITSRANTPREVDSNSANLDDVNWEQLAPLFAGGTPLPSFGPLAPTEATLNLVGRIRGMVALDLGCGEGQSLQYLLGQGAVEAWGLDASSHQLAKARALLKKDLSRVHLVHGRMEERADVPASYFDLVISIYAVGYVSELHRTMQLISNYLKPGGCLIFSDEHPVYSCLAIKGEEVVFQEPYTREVSHRKKTANGASIMMQKRTLGSFVNTVIEAGFRIERLIEGEINYDAVKNRHRSLESWYCVQKAQLMPTTFIIKARKPVD